MKILVTGGAGYIGSHTARLLKDRGDEVVIFDSMEFGHKQAINGLPLVVGNVQDKELVMRTLAEYGIEAVIHFAAYKAVGESMNDPAKYFINNFYGTVRLVEACLEAGVKKFVFSSTAAVYGSPEKLPISESTPVQPENPYGESKLMVERALRWFGERCGLKYAALRYFNVAGAAADGENGEDPRRAANLIPLVLNVATGRSEKISIFGNDYPTPDGTCVRDYIHVLDLAAAHASALDWLDRGDGKTEPIFNLGTGKGASVAEVLALAKEISGKEIKSEMVARRPGDPAAVWADNRKAVEILGWRPTRGMREIIADGWRWQSSHPDGFAD